MTETVFKFRFQNEIIISAMHCIIHKSHWLNSHLGSQSHIWVLKVTPGFSKSNLGSQSHIWVFKVTSGFSKSHLGFQSHIWVLKVTLTYFARLV